MILVPERRNDQNTRAQKISREPSRQKNRCTAKKDLDRDGERAPAGKLTSAREWLELGYQGTARERPPRLS
jgi:hypothetical protein